MAGAARPATSTVAAAPVRTILFIVDFFFIIFDPLSSSWILVAARAASVE